MTARKTLVLLAWPILTVLGAVGGLLPLSPAQGPSTFNEYQVKTSGTLNDDPKSDVWTLEFNFKAPRLIKANVPGRGTRICWYLWFQVINRTKEPRTFRPDFELVTHDYPGVYPDEVLTTVEDAIRKIEDPTGYQEIKNTVTISRNPIPVSLPPDRGFPKAVTGVAIWDGSIAGSKAPGDKMRDLSESRRFSIFVAGLSNGTVKVDPLTKGKGEPPITRRKTLQLNFKRAGDRYSLDSRDITFEAPAEWVYRAAPPLKTKGLDINPPAGKDGKTGAWAAPLFERDIQLQPVIHRGNVNGS